MALPRFAVELTAPDIAPWLAGNTGLRGFTTRDSGKPGPHAVLVALVHGNEIAGAIALDTLLARGLTPSRGRLTFGFANIAAFARFDPTDPIASRYIDEDLNRVWDVDVLDGTRHSTELDRAREIRPMIETADVLFDLHSMLWPSDPLILCGATERGRALGQSIGVPDCVIADPGHSNGRRLIDYHRFADDGRSPVANLVEAGQHWLQDTAETMLAAVAGLLRSLDMASGADALLPMAPAPRRPLYAEVTSVVTARTAGFTFMQPYRGGQVIRHRNTLLAIDGPTDIRTPYDNCLLVMPSLRPSRGHTAVRLARMD
ncbi:succinylglutamate desuccinylase/aspartoacylase family protein [Acidisoma cellulosilytica]|uniref:Succinylglutamate desuccinylase/aspartoacylase family protein n=2 Tax=Acidisoma cellulosilyticum TaxID=2802395 RepID=A0A964E2U2_9PROT|nr:succinylglutamate desuccinylase/aspartoacylase family protein [Acidisoma cellulosilyticum]